MARGTSFDSIAASDRGKECVRLSRDVMTKDACQIDGETMIREEGVLENDDW